MRMRSLVFVALGAATVLLAGCGGGGGGGALPPDNPGVADATLTGVAATGRPFAGATVSVFDSTNRLVGTTTVAVNGSYRISIPGQTTAPLVVEAVRGADTLVSAFPETRSSQLNITPVTNLMAALLAPDGNPLSLRANATAASAERVQARLDQIQAVLKPLSTTVADNTNPLTGQFTADGTGHDKLLDTLDVQIRPAGAVSNIEVAVRGADAAVRTAFTSADPAPPPLPPVAAADLPPDNSAALLQDLLQRITACFALPLQDRVNGATNNTGSVTGTAADVKAPACRTLFLDDDPATFLSNGATVGRDAAGNGAFTGLFRGGSTGLVFENPVLEFLRANDTHDLVFTLNERDAAGNLFPDQLIARKVGTTLKLVGNGYIYSARVRAFAQDREFVNQPAADYVSVGYNVNIANLVDGAGALVFDHVLVTAPNGATLTYKPSAARSFLTVVKPDGALSGSPVVRLAAKFKNPATAGRPEEFEAGIFVVSPQFTDDQLRVIPEKAVWRLEFFHVDPAKANVVQTYRTISRAPTLSEQASLVFAQPTATARTELAAKSAQFGVVFFGAPSATSPNVLDLSTAGGGDFWTVPAGAAPPTSITAFGIGPDPDGTGPQLRQNFNDGATVAPSARTARVTCSRQSAADNHCDNSTGVLQYANNSGVTSIELFAVSQRQVELSKIINTFFILPR